MHKKTLNIKKLYNFKYEEELMIIMEMIQNKLNKNYDMLNDMTTHPKFTN